MAGYVTGARFRKFSPVDREYPIFELVEGEKTLLDISASESGVIEVALHEAGANRVFTLKQLRKWLAEGEELIENEMK